MCSSKAKRPDQMKPNPNKKPKFTIQNPSLMINGENIQVEKFQEDYFLKNINSWMDPCRFVKSKSHFHSHCNT